jgi:hypothetical protein
VASRSWPRPKYWLLLLTEAEIVEPERTEPLLAETGELTRIFVASCRTAKQHKT